MSQLAVSPEISTSATTTGLAVEVLTPGVQYAPVVGPVPYVVEPHEPTPR